MADVKKKVKPPKTLLGVFEVILEDSTAEEDVMKQLVKDKIEPVLAKMNAQVELVKVIPVAFGAKKLNMRVIFKEAEGGTQPFEDAIDALKEVDRVECAAVSVIS